LDADTNLTLRYREFALVSAQRRLRRLLGYEVGATPGTDLFADMRRSPIEQEREIAFSGVPIEIWWRTRDRVVIDQARNSQALLDRILALNPETPVVGVVGAWSHTAEMWYFRSLPSAPALIGLLPGRDAHPFPRLGLHGATPSLPAWHRGSSA